MLETLKWDYEINTDVQPIPATISFYLEKRPVALRGAFCLTHHSDGSRWIWAVNSDTWCPYKTIQLAKDDLIRLLEKDGFGNVLDIAGAIDRIANGEHNPIQNTRRAAP
jgi:hypothetical protein